MQAPHTEVLDIGIKLKHSSVQSHIEVPREFDPQTDYVIMMLPGLAATGEMYGDAQHLIAQKTGHAVATLTWGRDWDPYYFWDVRREHAHQALAVAERIDSMFGNATQKILFCHSNGGGDGNEEAVFSLKSGRGGRVIGVDFEAIVGTDGRRTVNPRYALEAYFQTVSSIRDQRGRAMARASLNFYARNPPLLLAEAAAAICADTRPHMAQLQAGGVVFVNNMYRHDTLITPNPAAPNFRLNEGNHFTPIEPEVALANVADLTERIAASSRLVQLEHARAS